MRFCMQLIQLVFLFTSEHVGRDFQEVMENCFVNHWKSQCNIRGGSVVKSSYWPFASNVKQIESGSDVFLVIILENTWDINL